MLESFVLASLLQCAYKLRFLQIVYVFALTDPCTPNPCLNDMDCVPRTFGQGPPYFCQCEAGLFTGERCETGELNNLNDSPSSALNDLLPCIIVTLCLYE